MKNKPINAFLKAAGCFIEEDVCCCHMGDAFAVISLIQTDDLCMYGAKTMMLCMRQRGLADY